MSFNALKPAIDGSRLTQDSIGLMHIVFFVVAAAAPLTAVVGATPPAFAFGNGAGVPGAFVLAGSLYLTFSVGFTAMARYVGGAGAFYVYLAKGLGKPAGIGGAMMTLVSYNATATGRKVMARAAGTLKRLTLELGGNDAGIVLPDVDPAQIAEGLFWGAFINNGQTCAALKRLYVHDSIYDATCEALVDYGRTVVVGDGLQQHSALGPIQNEMQYKKVCDLVDDARAHEARILVGGEPAGGIGYFYPITLVADAHDDTRLVQEEQFGPVPPILRYAELDDAIVLANNSPWGLGGSIWSGDPQNARRHASRLECGSVWINRHGAIQPNAPFGGVKQSGIGSSLGPTG